MERKKQAVRYLNVDIADTWKSLQSFGEGKSYVDWKKDVAVLYPEADEEK